MRMRGADDRVTIRLMTTACPQHGNSRTWFLLLILLTLSACVRPGPGQPPPSSGVNPTAPGSDPATTISEATPFVSGTPLIAQLGTPAPEYAGSPTADGAHYSIDATGSPGSHTVTFGETLGLLAQRYGTTVEELMELNDLTDPDLVQVGQSLLVPGVEIAATVGPDFKIIPDSELVYGPAARDFDAPTFLAGLGGYLLRHQEEVEGQSMTGPAILQLVADRHSVNPRLLIAALEYRTGWATKASPAAITADMGYSGAGANGLYRQLSWAANLFNLGFYGRAEGGLRGFNLPDGSPVIFSPTVNYGTAGVQRYLGAIDGMAPDSWQRESGPDGFHATYVRLFGNPFAYSVDPLLPDGLESPALELPWAAGETWYMTSGPHGAWNVGSAWGALDFAPPGEQLGCILSDDWVTAAAAGTVTRSGNGAVVVDLDDDGYAGTGWAITYMHLETRDRVAVGTQVAVGDRLGHPSCEGGFSNGTHLHLVRSYNGRWISADGGLPFVLSGWVSSGTGTEYDGFLTRGETVREACVCREESNAITR